MLFGKHAEHPGAAQVSKLIDSFDHAVDGKTYGILVLEYERGLDFYRLLKLLRQCSPAQLKDWMSCAKGLQLAHELGIVHRDVKPRNIMYAPSGCKIIDWGIAYHERLRPYEEPGFIVGTPNYMAPEQIMGDIDSISPALDAYALGIMTFEALIGYPPFRSIVDSESDTAAQHDVAAQHLCDAVPNPTDLNAAIPTEIADVILQAVEKNPKDRFPNAGAFYDALMATPNERTTHVSVPGGDQSGTTFWEDLPTCTVRRRVQEANPPQTF